VFLMLLPHFYRTQLTAKGSVFGVVRGFFVCVSPEPLNGFAPNSQGRRVWSLARTSLKVKVKRQGKTSVASSFFLFYGRPYVVVGRVLCFTPVIHSLLIYYLFFALLSSRLKNAAPRHLCQDVGRWCNIITQIRRGPICIPYILRGENLPILPYSLAMVRLELV